MTQQAADHQKQAAEHHEQAAHQHKADSKGYEANQHEKGRTLPTSRMATANRRALMGLTRRSPLSNIMGIRSGAMKGGADDC
ncbi:MAG: hypothetical protein JJE16_00420 [Nitrospiraceae bacterium]|nr:hypothetical protein [Nitrospiraceae bacterium]